MKQNKNTYMHLQYLGTEKYFSSSTKKYKPYYVNGILEPPVKEFNNVPWTNTITLKFSLQILANYIRKGASNCWLLFYFTISDFTFVIFT
jgi:hypothetical protein